MICLLLTPYFLLYFSQYNNKNYDHKSQSPYQSSKLAPNHKPASTNKHHQEPVATHHSNYNSYHGRPKTSSQNYHHQPNKNTQHSSSNTNKGYKPAQSQHKKSTNKSKPQKKTPIYTPKKTKPIKKHKQNPYTPVLPKTYDELVREYGIEDRYVYYFIFLITLTNKLTMI